ncbi:MAG: DEAD/DEAH box helicase, partial [Planctomycetota bacterium]
KRIPQNRQTLLFGATMPQEIRTLANEILKNPVNIQVGSIAPAVTVSHALYPVSQHLKTSLLLGLLKDTQTESVLIFARTKQRAKRLAEQLIRSGHSAIAIQGNLSQARRQSAMNDFRKGIIQILVATDIVSRGIDVTQISHVINYDIPSTTEAYIHRIGRTGRAAKTGEAVTFITHEDTRMVRSIEKILGKKVERLTLEGFDYHNNKGDKEIPQVESHSSKKFHPREEGESQEKRRSPDFSQKRPEYKKKEYRGPRDSYAPKNGGSSSSNAPRGDFRPSDGAPRYKSGSKKKKSNASNSFQPILGR